MPDFLFFGLSLAGIESGHSHTSVTKATVLGYEITSSPINCFPYTAAYPYTHSTAGQISAAILFASVITLYYRLPLVSFATLILATLSHLPLDMVVRRDDSAIQGSEYAKPIWKRNNVPLFDYPWGMFISDLGMFIFAVLFHARTVYPPEGQTKVAQAVPAGGKKDMTMGYLGLMLLAATVQAHFTFLGAPVGDSEGEWADGVVFMAEIVGFTYALHMLEEYTSVEDQTLAVGDQKKKV
ncbi:hypothetical protein ABW20_dc0108662 [Dactylellina cionopaga]|nr:hypothetical protein ABW20_dc0108662 [Dactylellina cionopaga]